MLQTLKRLGTNFLDLVFPVSCLVCGREEMILCDSCSRNLPKLSQQKCLVCGKPAPYGKTHLECVSRNTVDGSISALTYQDRHVNKIIEVFKYNFVSDLAQPLAGLIIQAIADQNLSGYFEDFVIVPVPLHTRRYNWRGFNQSDLLARPLAEKLGLKLDESLVVRNKFTKPQALLIKEERKRNIANAFSLIGNAVNKKIILVDDLVTSGATANELAKLLKQSHATEIWVASVAHG